MHMAAACRDRFMKTKKGQVFFTEPARPYFGNTSGLTGLNRDNVIRTPANPAGPLIRTGILAFRSHEVVSGTFSERDRFGTPDHGPARIPGVLTTFSRFEPGLYRQSGCSPEAAKVCPITFLKWPVLVLAIGRTQPLLPLAVRSAERTRT